MGFWGNLVGQGGLGKALDPWELTPLGQDPDESRMEGLVLPDWKEDADYRETQDFLKKYGIDIMGGNVHDYYKGIGEAGGSEFDAYINSMTGDIQKSAMESSAALGRGGGRAMDVANQAVGDFTTKSRWADYQRALEGKQWLLGQGRGITEGVRGSGQAQQQQENAFALDRTNLDFKKRSYLDAWDSEQDAMSGEMLGNLASIGVNAAGGYITSGGNPLGAVAGAMGGTDWGSILDSASSKKALPTTTGTPSSNKTNLGKISGTSDIDLMSILNSLKN